MRALQRLQAEDAINDYYGRHESLMKDAFKANWTKYLNGRREEQQQQQKEEEKEEEQEDKEEAEADEQEEKEEEEKKDIDIDQQVQRGLEKEPQYAVLKGARDNQQRISADLKALLGKALLHTRSAFFLFLLYDWFMV